MVARLLARVVVVTVGRLVTVSARKLEAALASPSSELSVAATAAAAALSATKMTKETRTLALSRRRAWAGDGSRPTAEAEAEAEAKEASEPTRCHTGEARVSSRRRRAAPLLVALRKVAITCSVVTPTSAATSARILCRSPGKMLLSSSETITLYSMVDRASLTASLGAPKEKAAPPVGTPASASIAFCTSPVCAVK